MKLYTFVVSGVIKVPARSVDMARALACDELIGMPERYLKLAGERSLKRCVKSCKLYGIGKTTRRNPAGCGFYFEGYCTMEEEK